MPGYPTRTRRRERQRGFSIIETMVTLVVSAIVLAGIFEMFNALHKWSITNAIKAEMQQNARSGLETFTRDLEMAGYHTTNYGDTNKANLAVTYAAVDAVEMDQQRMNVVGNDLAAATYEPRLVYYHLRTDATTGDQNLYRQIRTEPGLPSPDELVAERVSAFDLSYFDKENVALDLTTPQSYTVGLPPPAVLKSIRRIEVTLTTEAARDQVPTGSINPTYTLHASVMPQNLENPENLGDLTPPAVPTGLNVVDSRSCGNKLSLRWSANAELDLAGYVVFYGATSKRVIPVSGLVDRGNPSLTLNPDDLLITKDADRVSSPNLYAIEVAAYDSSGNYSARSAAASANPDPDISSFGAGDDTTINPAKPSPPTSLTVAPGEEYQMVISWQPPTDGSATVGYRLYRSLTPFAGDAHIDGANQIASEATLTTGVTSFTDSGLEGCTTYYYAVASVNCDETLVAGYVYRTAGASDYAVASGMPADATPPPPPVLAGSLAGWQRAFITLKNPTVEECPDLLGSEIYFSRSAAPTLVDGVVVGGTLIPDSDHGVRGSFRNRGSQVVVFDSETLATPPSPTLLNQGTYSILAVTYDKCLNTSVASTALVLIELCGDDPAGPPPSAPETATFTSCEADAVTLGWAYPPKDATPPLYDFAGYRIERSGPVSGYPTVELTTGPTWLESWTDAGPLLAGGTYTYSVRATDCVYENQNSSYPLNRSLPLMIGPVHPGGLRRYADAADALAAENFVTTVSDAARPYTHHNNVVFHLQNTSAATQTLKRLAVTWDNPNVVLDQVVVGGSPSVTAERTIAAGGAASGSSVSLDVRVDDLAGGIGTGSGPIPIRLRFTTPSGAVNRLVDLRGELMQVSLWTQNDSLQPLECAAPDRIELEVPGGPVLGAFSQDTPGIYGISSYEVIGRSGTARDTDIKVPGGRLVNIFGTALDNSREVFTDGVNRGFSTLKLVGVDSAPTDAGVTPQLPVSGSFFERPLQSVGGDRYAIFDLSTLSGARMPVVSDRSVWYYALAVDRTGNWDRVPEPDFGAYAYHQLGPDVCLASAPDAPVLRGTTDASHAYLTWTAPTTYDDGGTIPPTDPLKYDLYYSHDGATGWTLVDPGDIIGTSFTFNGDMTGQAWYFHLKAKNSCAADPKISVASNVFRECEGAFGVYCPTFGVTPATATIGAEITVNAPDICMFKGNGNANDSVIVRVGTSLETKSFTLAEQGGDTGSFALTVTTTEASTSGPTEVRALSGSTLTVYLYTTDLVLRCTKYVTVTGGICSTTPDAPLFSRATRPSTSSRDFTLTWSAPTTNTDGSPLSDLAGYRLLYSTSTTPPTPPANTLTFTGTSPTTVTLPNAVRYYFWLQAFDSCAPPNYSANSSRVRANR